MDKTLIFEMFENCDFELIREGYYDEFLEDIPDYLVKTYDCGVTKLAIFPSFDDNIVIKIPFQKHFDSANYTPNHEWDYCFSEVAIYHKAKVEGLEKIFAKEKYIGEVKGYPIYVQVKCNLGIDIDEHTAKNSFDFIQNFHTHSFYGAYVFNPIWQAEALRTYGKKFYTKFIEFLDTYSLVDDLHEANLGYINGKPVLLDYSGCFDF